MKHLEETSLQFTVRILALNKIYITFVVTKVQEYEVYLKLKI